MNKNKAIIDYRKIPLFDSIEEDDLNSMLLCLRSYERSYKKGEIVILDQEKVSYIGIVLSGQVNMMKEDIWGNETMLTYMLPGDLIGETFAVQKETSSYVSFVAASPTNVLFLAASNIIHPCPRNCLFHSQLTQNMFDVVGRKSVRLMEKIEVTSKTSLREKILTYLSMQVQKQHTRYITIPLGRAELAEYLGANRSALTRELSTMRKEGLIDYDRNTFMVK